MEQLPQPNLAAILEVLSNKKLVLRLGFILVKGLDSFPSEEIRALISRMRSILYCFAESYL